MHPDLHLLSLELSSNALRCCPVMASGQVLTFAEVLCVGRPEAAVEAAVV